MTAGQRIVERLGSLQWRAPLVGRVARRLTSSLRRRDAWILSGPARGLRFNTSGSNLGYLLGQVERPVQDALVRLVGPRAVVYDVGANVGFLAVLAATLCWPEGRVVAFEPLPELARAVRHNAELNRLNHLAVEEVALSDADAALEFQVFEMVTRGRLASVGPAEGVQHTRRVAGRRLDSLLAEGRLPPPDVLKVDVEGAEGALLRGAHETLRRARPVLLVELHGTNREVAELLDAAGYAAWVLGGGPPVRDARWDAHVVAAPAERPDLVQAARELGRAS